jgi:hypothetical protein
MPTTYRKWTAPDAGGKRSWTAGAVTTPSPRPRMSKRGAFTSHYGRYRFTTYWHVEQDVNRELVKYMRGDKAGGSRLENKETMDTYLHTYYEDIEDLYRERIFPLGL